MLRVFIHDDRLETSDDAFNIYTAYCNLFGLVSRKTCI
jgi:hypothetical protein